MDEIFEDSLDFDGWNSDREMIIVPSVKNIHKELIEQALTLQINNSFSSASDYVETFNEQIESLLQEENTSIEDNASIRTSCLDFYCEVINLISDKFDLDADADTIRDKGYEFCKNACEAMYSFFIIRYKKNIKNIYSGFIIKNIKHIVAELESCRKKKDVTTVSIKKKVADSNMALIISNLDYAIGYVSALDLTMLEFIQYLNLDRYDIDMINNLMLLSIINSGYQDTYFAPIKKSYHDEAYDELTSSILKALYKNTKNKK